MTERRWRADDRACSLRGFAVVATIAIVATTAVGCGRSRRAPATEERAARTHAAENMHRLITGHLHELLGACRDLQAAAPVPAGRGWDAHEDARAIAAMKAAWSRGRRAYELVEGAVASIFPESDVATDARYDDFLTGLGSRGDPTPFDDDGITGMHAIERILWADRMPAAALAFERGLPGYRPAAFPVTEAEARSFRDALAGKLVRDVEMIEAQTGALELDIAFVVRGILDLAAEQAEKIDRAATGREESRYALVTMRDLRANRQGCFEAYSVVRPWLRGRAGGPAVDDATLAALERLRVGYDAVVGDAIPTPPPGWSGLSPAEALLTTPFGRLFALVRRESDEKASGSLVASLLGVIDTLGLPPPSRVSR